MVLLKNWNLLVTPPGQRPLRFSNSGVGSLTSHKNRISESATFCSTGRHSPNWANQAVAVASKSFGF